MSEKVGFFDLPLDVVKLVFLSIPVTRRRLALCITCKRYYRALYPLLQKIAMAICLPISPHQIEACLKAGLRITTSNRSAVYDFQSEPSGTDDVKCVGFCSSYKDPLKMYGRSIVVPRLLDHIRDDKMEVVCKPRLAEQFIVHPRDIDRVKKKLAKELAASQPPAPGI